MRILRLAPVLFLGIVVGCGSPTRPAGVLPHSSTTTPIVSSVPVDPIVPAIGDLACNYRIKLTAANCDLNFPSQFASRTYRSRVAQTTTGVALEVFQMDGGATVDPVLRGAFAPPDRMSLTSYLGNEQWEGLFEQVSPTNLVSILVDEMSVTVSPQGMSGTFEGAFLLYLGSAGSWPHVVAQCLSEEHTVHLMR